MSMSDPQIYDLSTGCVAIAAPEGKPYATIVALPNGEVSVYWTATPPDPAQVQASYWPIAGATQYQVYDVHLDCAAAIPANLTPANNAVVVFAEDTSTNAPACVMPGTVWVAPTAIARGITLVKAAAGVTELHPASFRNVNTDLYFAGWVKVMDTDPATAVWMDADGVVLDKAIHVLIEFG